MRGFARSCALGMLSLLAGMFLPPTAEAGSTRPQHRDWIRKFEAGGGSFDAHPTRAVSPLVSNDTRSQHLRWSQRLQWNLVAPLPLAIEEDSAGEPPRKLRLDRPAARD